MSFADVYLVDHSPNSAITPIPEPRISSNSSLLAEANPFYSIKTGILAAYVTWNPQMEADFTKQRDLLNDSFPPLLALEERAKLLLKILEELQGEELPKLSAVRKERDTIVEKREALKIRGNIGILESYVKHILPDWVKPALAHKKVQIVGSRAFFLSSIQKKLEEEADRRYVDFLHFRTEQASLEAHAKNLDMLLQQIDEKMAYVQELPGEFLEFRLEVEQNQKELKDFTEKDDLDLQKKVKDYLRRATDLERELEVYYRTTFASFEKITSWMRKSDSEKKKSYGEFKFLTVEIDALLKELDAFAKASEDTQLSLRERLTDLISDFTNILQQYNAHEKVGSWAVKTSEGAVCRLQSARVQYRITDLHLKEAESNVVATYHQLPAASSIAKISLREDLEKAELAANPPVKPWFWRRWFTWGTATIPSSSKTALESLENLKKMNWTAQPCITPHTCIWELLNKSHELETLYGLIQDLDRLQAEQRMLQASPVTNNNPFLQGLYHEFRQKCLKLQLKKNAFIIANPSSDENLVSYVERINALMEWCKDPLKFGSSKYQKENLEIAEKDPKPVSSLVSRIGTLDPFAKLRTVTIATTAWESENFNLHEEIYEQNRKRIYFVRDQLIQLVANLLHFEYLALTVGKQYRKEPTPFKSDKFDKELTALCTLHDAIALEVRKCADYLPDTIDILEEMEKTESSKLTAEKIAWRLQQEKYELRTEEGNQKRMEQLKRGAEFYNFSAEALRVLWETAENAYTGVATSLEALNIKHNSIYGSLYNSKPALRLRLNPFE